MTVPSEPVPVPELVADIAAGRPVSAVWVNELGGVTFAVDDGREYVKVSPPEWAQHLSAERERLAWAAAHIRVPQVLGAGDGWLHTAGLPGRSAVDPVWVADPRTAARAIGAGLRLLHDALPVGQFPFGPPPWVTEQGPVDRLVVCHGDACAP
ncbi:MAG TPA: aminoglycoside 3'-phosphotransferase, partial [Mycobacterium sp.]|nr:aminoglycoside 3'-phosphotransferase [Mycobacterium sp.]